MRPEGREPRRRDLSAAVGRRLALATARPWLAHAGYAGCTAHDRPFSALGACAAARRGAKATRHTATRDALQRGAARCTRSRGQGRPVVRFRRPAAARDAGLPVHSGCWTSGCSSFLPPTRPLPGKGGRNMFRSTDDLRMRGADPDPAVLLYPWCTTLRRVSALSLRLRSAQHMSRLGRPLGSVGSVQVQGHGRSRYGRVHGYPLFGCDNTSAAPRRAGLSWGWAGTKATGRRKDRASATCKFSKTIRHTSQWMAVNMLKKGGVPKIEAYKGNEIRNPNA